MEVLAPTRRRWTWRWAALALFAWASVVRVAHGQGVASSEWDVKAVLLYNMAQFVEWPATAFGQTNAPLVIGVLGRDPFGKALEEVVRGESVDGHQLIVQRFATVAEVGACHILYISWSERADVGATLNRLRTRPILTVGDAAVFARTPGGIVQFYTTPEGKIRLRINIAHANAAGLKISSKLLRVSDVVGGAN